MWPGLFISQEGEKSLTLFDGNTWIQAPEDFPNLYNKCTVVDEKNNLWLGTDIGIYFLEQ